MSTPQKILDKDMSGAGETFSVWADALSTILVAIFSGGLGVVVAAIVQRRKTNAEAVKVHAEAQKIHVDTDISLSETAMSFIRMLQEERLNLKSYFESAESRWSQEKELLKGRIAQLEERVAQLEEERRNLKELLRRYGIEDPSPPTS